VGVKKLTTLLTLTSPARGEEKKRVKGIPLDFLPIDVAVS
jgi:hypothetical protein